MNDYQSKQEKGPHNIKRRLNNLEVEINNIRDALTKRKVNQNESAVVPPRATVLNAQNRVTLSASKDKALVNNDICNYLQNITKHIAKGSEAIRRIASFTEVSSLSQSCGTALGFSSSELESELTELQRSYSNSGVFNSVSDQTVTGGSRRKVPYGFPDHPSIRERDNQMIIVEAKPSRKGIIELKKEILQENHILKQKLAEEDTLKNELTDLKKKLKEETKKRCAAEKKAEEIQKKSGQIGDSPLEKGDGVLITVQEKLATLEEKYVQERKQREDLEKDIAALRVTLEENERQKAGLSHTRDIAIAVADKLWSRVERRESSSFCSSGQGDDGKFLKKLSETTAPDEAQMIYEKIKEQILAAEKRNKPEKDPLSIPQVRSHVEKLEKAYEVLALAKEQTELELAGKINYLEASLEHHKRHYGAKTRKLLDRVQELTHQLKTRTIAIEEMSKRKIDSAVQHFKEIVEGLETKKKQQHELLDTKEETINKMEHEMQNIQKELDDVRRQLAQLNQMAEDTESQLTEKNDLIERMKREIDGKQEALAIKEKMMADNVDTIRALKMAVDANRQLVEDIKNSSNSLKSDKIRLEKENEKLTRNIGQLEKVVEEANQYKAAQERNLVQLKKLETQVYERQTEWEQQLMAMKKEKNEAIQSARYTTQKLYRSLQDFEKQLAAQKETERQLRRALELKGVQQLNLNRREDEPMRFVENRPQKINACADFVAGYSSTTSTTSTD